MEEMLLEQVSSATTLEEEIAEEERLALAEQADADRLLARAAGLTTHVRERLAAVAAVQAVLMGEHPPCLVRHEEPLCHESLTDWLSSASQG